MNFSPDEKDILVCEASGKPFYKMSENELLAASNALCLKLSKISGCSLPRHSEQAEHRKILLQLFRSVSDFIVRNKRFRLLTPAEIALAANWNAAGEFSETVKHFNQELNLEYIGGILNLYCRYKLRLGLKEKLEMETVKFLPTTIQVDPFYWERQIEFYYQQYRSGKLNFLLLPHEVFSKLVDFDYCRPYLFVNYLQNAYQLTVYKIEDEITAAKRLGAKRHHLHEKLSRINEYKYSNNDVLFLAKRMAAVKFFEFWNSRGNKNLFIEE